MEIKTIIIQDNVETSQGTPKEYKVLISPETINVSPNLINHPVNILSASYAETASFMLGSISNAISASYAATASLLLGSVISSSYALTASYASNANANIISPKEIYVSVNANGINQYKTILNAINNYTTGSTIILAPETFNEDVIISGSGFVIQGVDRKNTVVKNLTITGKDCSVSNLFISGNLTLLSTHSFVPFVGNEITSCDILGDVNFGISGSINNYQIIVDDCWFKGTNKNIVINSKPDTISWGWSPLIKNSIIRDKDDEVLWHPSSGSYTLTTYGGNVHFQYCPILYFTKIIYESASLLSFDTCYSVEVVNEMEFNYDSTHLLAGEGHMVFNLEKSGFFYENNPLNIRYKTEFNLIHSFFFTNATTINFDSLAISRWLYTTQKIWGSTTTLGGTGLNNLLIQNCIFHMDAPEVLHTDAGNAWLATIDY